MKQDFDKLEFDRRHIWHPFTSLQSEPPVHIIGGEGAYLLTSDGKKIFDAVSSWWVNLHGHGNPVIAKAIYEQALVLEHVIFAGFTHDPAITLARNLINILPKNQARIFFSDNGSTAVEVALKMAMQYWFNSEVDRKRVIALEGAYHGDTFGAMSVGERGAFTRPFNPYLFDVKFLPLPTEGNFEKVRDQFISLCARKDVAAFIYEPLVQGAAGMVMYEGRFLAELMSIAKEHDVICIADEVFTGFGRTGRLFASDHLNIMPDIMALSKGITGGTLPLGVTTCSEKISKAYDSAEQWKTFFHGHSYTANPIACAAANASFNLLTSDACRESIKRISRRQGEFVKKISAHPQVKQARCTGTILAIEINTPSQTSYFNDLRKSIYSFFLGRNILLRPLGNIIYMLPPYVSSDHDLIQAYDAIEIFLDQLSTEQIQS